MNSGQMSVDLNVESVARSGTPLSPIGIETAEAQANDEAAAPAVLARVVGVTLQEFGDLCQTCDTRLYLDTTIAPDPATRQLYGEMAEIIWKKLYLDDWDDLHELGSKLD